MKFKLTFLFFSLLIANLVAGNNQLNEIKLDLNDFNQGYTLIQQQWEKNKLKDVKNLDEIFALCNSESFYFDWEKYSKMSNEEINALLKDEKEKLNKTAFCLKVLAMGYIINNKTAKIFWGNLKNKIQQFTKEYLIKQNISQYNLYQAKQMLKTDYNDKLKLLYSFFKEQETSRNNNFLVGLSNDDQFLLTLKEDAKSKDTIISLIKNEFDKLKNDNQESRALRSAYIRFYTALSTPEKSLKWVEDILNSPNVSTYEKSVIKRNVVPRLKIELEKIH